MSGSSQVQVCPGPTSVLSFPTKRRGQPHARQPLRDTPPPPPSARPASAGVGTQPSAASRRLRLPRPGCRLVLYRLFSARSGDSLRGCPPRSAKFSRSEAARRAPAGRPPPMPSPSRPAGGSLARAPFHTWLRRGRPRPRAPRHTCPRASPRGARGGEPGRLRWPPRGGGGACGGPCPGSGRGASRPSPSSLPLSRRRRAAAAPVPARKELWLALPVLYWRIRTCSLSCWPPGAPRLSAQPSGWCRGASCRRAAGTPAPGWAGTEGPRRLRLPSNSGASSPSSPPQAAPTKLLPSSEALVLPSGPLRRYVLRS